MGFFFLLVICVVVEKEKKKKGAPQLEAGYFGELGALFFYLVENTEFVLLFLDTVTFRRIVIYKRHVMKSV